MVWSIYETISWYTALAVCKHFDDKHSNCLASSCIKASRSLYRQFNKKQKLRHHSPAYHRQKNCCGEQEQWKRLYRSWRHDASKFDRFLRFVGFCTKSTETQPSYAAILPVICYYSLKESAIISEGIDEINILSLNAIIHPTPVLQDKSFTIKMSFSVFMAYSSSASSCPQFPETMCSSMRV